MSRQIAVLKEGHEGGIHISALDGKVVTPIDERPEWAEGYAVAMLTERVGHYEQRLGQALPDRIRSPDLLLADDLEWIGLDAEGEEVHIEANSETRMSLLAKFLGVDLEDVDAKAIFSRAIATAEVTETYRTEPTDEATLGEIEGQDFGTEATRAAVSG